VDSLETENRDDSGSSGLGSSFFETYGQKFKNIWSYFKSFGTKFQKIIKPPEMAIF